MDHGGRIEVCASGRNIFSMREYMRQSSQVSWLASLARQMLSLNLKKPAPIARCEPMMCHTRH
jgi:hypothetical protein